MKLGRRGEEFQLFSDPEGDLIPDSFDRDPFVVRFEETDTGESWGLRWDGQALDRLPRGPMRFDLKVRASKSVLAGIIDRDPTGKERQFVAADHAVKGEVKISGSNEDRMNRITDFLFFVASEPQYEQKARSFDEQ